MLNKSRRRNICLLLAAALLLAGCDTARDDNVYVPGSGNKLASETEADSLANEGYPTPTSEQCKPVNFARTVERMTCLAFQNLPGDAELTELLNILSAHNAYVTFFITGSELVERYEAIIRIAEQGHEIANSTFSNKDLTMLDSSEVVKDIVMTNMLIHKYTGKLVSVMHTKKYNDNVIKLAGECGMKYLVEYSIDLTFSSGYSYTYINNQVAEKIARGSVIGLNASNYEVLKAAGMILETLKSHNFEPTTFSRLSALDEGLPLLADLDDQVAVNTTQARADYSLLNSAPNDKKRIAFTFNGFANETWIDKMLKILEDADVKATFFVSNYEAANYPNALRVIARAGHEVANGGYEFKDYSILSSTEVQEQIVKNHDFIKEATGAVPALYFRPPSGRYNNTVLNAAALAGYKTTVMWDINPQDYTEGLTPEEIFDRVEAATPENGGIALFHLYADRATYTILPEIIKMLKDRGYSVGSVGEMLEEQETPLE